MKSLRKYSGGSGVHGRPGLLEIVLDAIPLDRNTTFNGSVPFPGAKPPLHVTNSCSREAAAQRVYSAAKRLVPVLVLGFGTRIGVFKSCEDFGLASIICQFGDTFRIYLYLNSKTALYV